MIVVLQAAQPFVSWSLQSTLALWGAKASITRTVWGTPSFLVPWYSGESCKHFSFCDHDQNNTNQSLQHWQNKSQPPVTRAHAPQRASHCSIPFLSCAGHSLDRAWHSQGHSQGAAQRPPWPLTQLWQCLGLRWSMEWKAHCSSTRNIYPVINSLRLLRCWYMLI